MRRWICCCTVPFQAQLLSLLFSQEASNEERPLLHEYSGWKEEDDAKRADGELLRGMELARQSCREKTLGPTLDFLL